MPMVPVWSSQYVRKTFCAFSTKRGSFIPPLSLSLSLSRLFLLKGKERKKKGKERGLGMQCVLQLSVVVFLDGRC